MNPGIRILPLPCANGLFEGRMKRWRAEQLLILKMRNYPWRRINHKLANGMMESKRGGGNYHITFSPKGLEILPKVRREQVNTIMMEHFISITSLNLLTNRIPINQNGIMIISSEVSLKRSYKTLSN